MNTTNPPLLRTTTPEGIFFVDVAQDAKMGSVLSRGVHPNAALVALAKQFTTKDSVVLDIGAHIGTFAVPAAMYAKKVIAFEPSPATFEVLTRNARENTVVVDARNKGLGASASRASLVGRNDTNAGAQTLGVGDDIEVATLDSEVSHADFIKIDVEGMEAQVLEGGRHLISTSQPLVFFELNLSQLRAHNTTPKKLERFFTKQGYRLYLPIEKKEGTYELARVRNLTLMTACIAPRAWLLSEGSAPFDILAAPGGREVMHKRFGAALSYAIGNNIAIKMQRIGRLFRKK